PPARISFSASVQNGVFFAMSAPTCSTYSCQLFSISSLKSCASVPSRNPCWRLAGWYTTRSETSARASRRAFCFGSCTRNGFTGRNGPDIRCAIAGTGAGGREGGGGAGGARGVAGAPIGAEPAGDGRAARSGTPGGGGPRGGGAGA